MTSEDLTLAEPAKLAARAEAVNAPVQHGVCSSTPTGMSLPSPKTPLPLFERLLEINRETFEGGHHDTAYHTLMAALHYAQDSANVEGLLNVAETATRQLAWIDAHVR